MSLINKRHNYIVQWINEAAEEIKEGIKYTLDIDEKSGKNDLVTNLDKQTENNLTNKIRENFPEDYIVSEEGFGDNLKDLKGTVWFVDPIDGTLNFVKQRNNYAIMIAVYEDGVGIQGYIYNVVEDKLYYAIKGKGAYCNDTTLAPVLDQSIQDGLIACNSALVTTQATVTTNKIIQAAPGIRMIGSAGLEAVEVAISRVSAYFATRLKPWDIASGKIIVEELGGKVTKFNGGNINLLETNPTIFANKLAHDEITKILSP